MTLTKGFWLGVYPVTQRQWRAVMGKRPRAFKGDDRPAERVSWVDCAEFCSAMGKKTALPVRLPTETEWEYSARAGTTTAFFTGDGLEAMHQAGWSALPGQDKRTSETKPVGSYPCNGWGLYDLHGNVREWCSDWYGVYPTEEAKDPTGPASGSSRILRGGGWSCYPDWCRSASRDYNGPPDRLADFGCRVVCEHAPPGL